MTQENPPTVAASEQVSTAPSVPHAGMALLAVNSRTTIIGGLICLATLATFTSWAMLAPLNSAVVANGFVKVSGYRQKVQHLEGGIVAAIDVKEGDVVSAGQVLYRLTNAQLLSARKLLVGQMYSARALEARIKAEQVEADQIAFPQDVIASTDPDVQQFVEAQRIAFDARRAAYRGSIAMKNERIKQTHEETSAYHALIKSLHKQLPLIQMEVSDQQLLWDKQLTRKAQLHQLRRTEAQIEAEIDKNKALVARTRASVAEIEEDKLQQRRKMLDELAQERKTVSDTLHDLRQRLVALDDAVERLVVRSPIAGVVMSRTANTIGGVVSPREVLVEIVPQEARLLIEASIRPSDIDIVKAGLPVQIQFSAYTARRTNRVMGKVAMVSADRLVDNKGQPGFRADIEVDQAEVKRIAGLLLYPGMPADAFIETGSHTFARYLMAPILDGILRGVRER